MEEKYIISDVSKILKVEPHVLRYWEEELSLNISRNQLGHRYYSKSNLEDLKKIKELKEQGLQLKAIKLMLSTKTALQPIEVNNTGIKLQQGQNVNKESSDKLKQFEMFIKDVFQSSLEESNKVLKEEITEELSARIQPMFNIQEEREEERFRRLDENIRQIQKSRQEVAVTKTKTGFFGKRKDKS